MALINPCFKDQNWSHLGEETMERKEKNVKEKKKKERRSSQASQRYGTTWTSNVLNGSPCLYSH